MSRITQPQLESYLWGAAVLLRGLIDAGDYKQFIFPLLFYKRVADVWEEEYQAALANSQGDLSYAQFAENHRCQIPAGAHWNDVRQTPKNVGAAIQRAMRAIESANRALLDGIFGDAPWTHRERLPDETLKDLIEHFSTQTLSVRRSVFERAAGRTRLTELTQTITSGSRGWAAHYSTDGEQFLRVGNLSHESIELNLSDLQRVKAPDDLAAKRTQVRTGDVLLGITGEAGVGRVGLVREGLEASYVSQHIALIRADQTRADPEFIAHMLAGHDGQQQVFRSNQAGAKAGLTLKAVKKLSIPALEVDAQRLIAETLSSIQRAVSEARTRAASRLLPDRWMLPDGKE